MVGRLLVLWRDPLFLLSNRSFFRLDAYAPLPSITHTISFLISYGSTVTLYI